jgi:hypothetical protein
MVAFTDLALQFNSLIVHSIYCIFLFRKAWIILSKTGFSAYVSACNYSWGRCIARNVRPELKKGQRIGFEVLTAVVMQNYDFWDIISSSQLKINRRFRRSCRLLYFQPAFRSWLAYSSTVNMEATYSSEAPVGVKWTTWPYILEDALITLSPLCKPQILYS